MRRLISIRRSVPTDDRPEYDASWRMLEQHSREGGFHAWRFRAAYDPDEYIEFLEFATGDDPRHLDAVRATLDAMRARFPGPAEDEWIGIDA